MKQRIEYFNGQPCLIPLSDDEENALAESLGWTVVPDKSRYSGPGTNWSKFEKVIDGQEVVVWASEPKYIRAVRYHHQNPNRAHQYINRTVHDTLEAALTYQEDGA